MRGIIFFLVLLYTLTIYSIEIKENHLTVSSGKIIFLSEAPQETIKGVGKQFSGEIHFKEKKVKIIIDLTDWRTNSKLQTSHLHDNYLETEKFPKATFEGLIQSYDSKIGEVSVMGSLTIHGITKKDVSIKGKVTATDSGYALASEFTVNLKDFSIEVPKLLILKVSEIVKLDVKVELKSGK